MSNKHNIDLGFSILAKKDNPKDNPPTEQPDEQRDSKQDNRIDNPLDNKLDNQKDIKIDNPIDIEQDSKINTPQDKQPTIQKEKRTVSKIDPLAALISSKKQNDKEFIGLHLPKDVCMALRKFKKEHDIDMSEAVATAVRTLLKDYF